jgi:hypothetical protein
MNRAQGKPLAMRFALVRLSSQSLVCFNTNNIAGNANEESTKKQEENNNEINSLQTRLDLSQ